jgi:methionine biosynthesis protein MetW
VRDSSLKRFLVTGYFTAAEMRTAVRGMFRSPAPAVLDADYDAYWSHRDPGGVQPRFEIIAGAIHRGDRVLDVGCGDGAMLEFLAGSRGAIGIGLDVSARAVARALTRGVDARAESLDAFESAAPDPFDHVVLSEVVEHVADAEGLVRAAWRLTRGTLWVTFPNIGYFPHRLRLLTGRFPVQWVVFPSEHLRFWTIPDFRDWIRALGLPQPSFTASNGLALFGLNRAWPNLLANQIVVRIDRPPERASRS